MQALTTFLLFALVGLSAAQWTLVKEDNFDELNTEFWQHEITMGGGGNWEFQMYTNNRSTSFVKDGILYLRPVLTRDSIGDANVRGNNYRYDLWGSNPANLCTGNAFYGCERTAGAGGNYLNPIKSARIRTAETFNMKYGKVEIRAQTPKGDWLWPAIWMLPKSNYYGEWPASGEIDIMESRGNSPVSGFEGRDYVLSTLHWGPHYPQNGFELTSKALKKSSGAWSDSFHTYTVEWTPEKIVTYVDGVQLLNVDMAKDSFWNKGGWNGSVYENPWANRPNNAPFDQPMYLILNVAVGGTGGFFPDNYPGKPWSNQSPNAVNQFYDAQGSWLPSWEMTNQQHPAAMKVDYVKFYCLTGHKDSCTIAQQPRK